MEICACRTRGNIHTVSKRKQTCVPSRLERALTALDADYILNDEGGNYFHQPLAGEE
jgi:hypothetical protein